MANSDENVPETEDQQDPETERPLILGENDCSLEDTDYLDPKLRVEGVIMVWNKGDSIFHLYGEVLESGEYVRTWQSVEITPGKPAKTRNLRSV